MEQLQKIPEKYEGQRIDAFAHTFFPGISRSQIQKSGVFFVKKESEFLEKPGKTKVSAEEIWKIQYEEKIPGIFSLSPWNFPLKILKESADWVAIEKPEGVSVHPSISEKNPEKTILNALVAQFGEKNLSQNEESIDDQTIPRPGLVHRLDKETSGVLLVAKNTAFHHFVQKHWKETKKVYYAVVHGSPPEKGKIQSGIQRDTNDRQKMMVSDSEKSREAITYFERVEISQEKKKALLKITIPTGRTHQIRVHLSSIGFPILGDTKYGGEPSNRLYLHAQSLTFPSKNEGVVEVVSDIPEKFLGF